MRHLKKQLYHLGERLRGWSVHEKLEQLKEMEHWDQERIYDFQLAHLKEVTRFAYEYTPFYKQFWDEAGVHPDQIKTLDDLSQFPKTHKQLLRDAGDDAIAYPHLKKQYVRYRTSGSTGKPFSYYMTKEHYSWLLASFFSGFNWAGWEMGDPWLRLQWLGDRRGELGLRAKFDNWVFNCLYMSLSTLGSEYIHDFVKKIKRFEPVMLRGFTAATYVFAKYLLEHPDEQFSVKTVVCTGDTLHPHFREAIEEAFQAPVYDGYGGEGMRVINQCEKGPYHIVPYVLVETEPEGPATEDGQPCRLILTSLTNQATPFIRYEIGDVAIMGEGSCSCGRTWNLIKKIIGRETDIVVTPAGHHLVCHHFNNILKLYSGVDQFQILQDEVSSITMRLMTNEAHTKEEAKLIKQKFEGLGGEGFTVNIEQVDDIPMTQRGKRRYIVSKVLKQAT